MGISNSSGLLSIIAAVNSLEFYVQLYRYTTRPNGFVNEDSTYLDSNLRDSQPSEEPVKNKQVLSSVR